MNQTFLEFNDKTISSGIIKTNSSLGEDLKTTMLRFLELAREAASEGDLEAPVQNTSQTQEDSPPTISELRPTRAKPRRAIRSTSIQSVSSPEILNHPASMMGYAVSYDDEDTAQDPDDGDIEIVEQLENYGSNDFDTMWDNGSAIIQQYHAKIPEIPASPQKWDAAADMALKTTYTYSFQEKSFGRRLLRASYEAAYHYLTNPDSRVHDVEYKLRYSLCIAGDKNRVIARIHDILTRSSNQSLEHWDTPMRHIGGSGLHYPRSNLREDTPPDDWASTQAVGPFKPRNALMGIPDRDYPQNLLKIANVEGPWFDSNDVEHYLRTKGLFLDGHTSIAEIEVDEAVPGLTGSFAAGSPTSTFSDSFGDSHSDPQSPRQGNDIASTYSLPPGDYFSEVQTRHNVSPMQPIMDFHSMSVDSDITAGWPEDGTFKAADMLGVNQPAMFSELETFDYVQPRRKLTIDVDKLLEGERHLPAVLCVALADKLSRAYREKHLSWTSSRVPSKRR